MKIAYLINQYPKVSHSFIRREIQALERQGLEVLRIALRGWDAEIVDREDLREREITKFVLRHGPLPLIRAVLGMAASYPSRFLAALRLAISMGRRAERPLAIHLIYLAEACRMVPWLKRFGATHLHAHFGTNSAEVAMLAHVLGGPSYSVTVHGPEEFDKPQQIRLGEKVHRAKFIAAISAYGRSQLFRWTQYSDWGKIKVVHCGLERAFYDVPAVSVPSAPRLVCVGRLCEQKGQLLLVAAAALLKHQGISFELVFAGDGEMRGEIENLVKQHTLDQNVRITGWISSNQVRDELLAARALVLPSFAEGLPVVIMEALALRRPVISTYVAGIPELVRHGESGWLVPAGDIAALADAMTTCLRASTEELQRLGEQGYRRVIEHHSIDTEAAKLVELFSAEAVS